LKGTLVTLATLVAGCLIALRRSTLLKQASGAVRFVALKGRFDEKKQTCDVHCQADV
jgi:hypothetical protein